MRFATFNCNSIRARLQIIINWLDKEKPDILCLQETKVQDKDFPVKRLEATGYHVIFKGQKSYNGVAILSRHDPVDVRTYLENPEEDARFLSAVICNIPVLNVYVPQGFSPESEKFIYKLAWLKNLLDHLNGNYDPTQDLILAGDFNVALEAKDVYDPEGLKGEVGFHPEEQAALRKLLNWGLVDIFRKHEPNGGHYTFWDYRIPNAFKRKMGWRIDYILATSSLAHKSKGCWIDTEARLLPKPSDHTFLVAEFDVPC